MTSTPSVLYHLLRLWLLASLAALLLALLLNPAPATANPPPSPGPTGEGGRGVRATPNHAALIIRDAEGRITYAWVPFPEEEINGIDLLKRSGIPVVTVGFGALGEGVCSIGGQGCGVAECRRNVCQASGANAPYWQYFKQDPTDPANWIWQPLGASASDVRDGDVFGWSWTAADPLLPALSAAEIAALAGAADPESAEPAERTVLPEGVAAFQPPPAPDAPTTAAAITILVAIGLTAAALATWRRRAAAADSSPPRVRPLDPRAWLLWAIAASLPPLLGRNPWPLAATLLAVLGVWAAWGTGAAAARWRPLLRLALVFAVVSVLFNLLTAHVGDRVIGSLPESWPVIGGPLTLNALVFGLLGAMAIFALVAVSATLGATLDWSATMRLLPDRMAPLAVAGSIAWSYLPRTTVALAEIREAQMARGYRPRGLLDAAPLVIPLLAGGLERALMTAEALEARAFGAPLSPAATPQPWQIASLLGGLVAALTGAFCLALGQIPAATGLFVLAVVAFALGLRSDRSASSLKRTRYRDPLWERPEWLITAASLAVLAIQIAVLVLSLDAFRYEPYPSLTAPAIELPLLAALALLLIPAAVRP